MTARLCLLAAIGTFPIFAQIQIQDLATTEDGGAVYFSSVFRLKGTSQPLQGKLFVVDAGGLRLFAQRDQESTGPSATNFFQLEAPRVSGDGSIVAFTGRNPLGTWQGTIQRLRDGTSVTVSGSVVSISRNGRFAVASRRAQGGSWFADWIDLTTGEEIRVADSYVSSRQIIAADGAVLLRGGPRLILWRKSGVETLRNSEPAGDSAINDAATRVVYWGLGIESVPKLIVYEVASGKETVLASGRRLSFRMSLSSDASRILFLEPVGNGPPQAFVAEADGSGLRRITNSVDGIADAVLSGDGQVVYAVTTGGELLRIKVATEETTRLIERTPWLHQGASLPRVVPGSSIQLSGSGLADATYVAEPPLPTSLGGVELLVGEIPMPLVSVSPSAIRWQVPWEMPTGPATVRLVSGNSPFETLGLASLSIHDAAPSFYGTWAIAPGLSTFTLIAAHSQFEALVTFQNPARSGEVIHTYMAGLGAVTPRVATGAPAPSEPLAVLERPLRCRFSDGEPHDAEVLFAGLAPGMVGIYQVSVRVPSGLRTTYPGLGCGFGEAELRPSGIIPVGGR